MASNTPTPTTDADAHLLGTPWDTWRREVAAMMDIAPAGVSNMDGAYEAFNTLVSPSDYVDAVAANVNADDAEDGADAAPAEFSVEFSTTNAAFEENAPAEIARILRELAGWIERDGAQALPCAVYDINGNRVGAASWS